MFNDANGDSVYDAADDLGIDGAIVELWAAGNDGLPGTADSPTFSNIFGSFLEYSGEVSRNY